MIAMSAAMKRVSWLATRRGRRDQQKPKVLRVFSRSSCQVELENKARLWGEEVTTGEETHHRREVGRDGDEEERERKKEGSQKEGGRGRKEGGWRQMEGEGGGNDVFRWGSHFSPVDWTDLAREILDIRYSVGWMHREDSE